MTSNLRDWTVLVNKIMLNGTCIKKTYKSRKECVTDFFFYFSTKTYDAGTQKNRLAETVLLSTQNTCLNWWIRQ